MLPAAVALAPVNPLPVVAIILVLFAPPGAVAAAAFLGGRLVGLVGLLAVPVLVGRPAGWVAEPTALVSVVRIDVGNALLAAPVRK